MKSKKPLTKLVFKIGNKKGFTHWDNSRFIKFEYVQSNEKLIASLQKT